MGPRRGYMNGKQDPTQAVASGIFQINTAVSTFQRLVNTLGTPKDTPELREKLHKTRVHIGQLVKNTSAKLKQASETDHRVEVSASKKITDAKLAKDFQAVLKEFQKAQRLAAERETAYTPFVPQAVLPSRFTMELHDLLARCLAMIITVILIARISSFLDTAVLSEVHASYVAKSYFNKHDNVVDSKFEDFIAHDILSGACLSLQGNVEFAPKLSALHGKLIGEGSHRRLSSTLRLKMSSESISRPPKSCEVIIVERLPSGVFADPFELQHLVQRGVFRDAVVFGDTNLELPSFLSNRSLVEVHLEVGTNLTSQQKDELEIHMELPLHARYQPLGHGFSRVEFASPDLFLRCNVERKEHDTSCLFLLDKQNAESIDTHPVWEVPCGNREHTQIVSAFTFISAVVSALLIIVASIRQEVLLLDNEIAFNEAIIEEREQGIQEIQQQIGEVNEIFKGLAVLVHEQGAMIDDIGSNVENAHAATAQGRSQLAKAAKTQRSNSSLTCLLLVIFGIVLLIVIIVLAA